MAMPKGFKSENGYGTSKKFDGMTYHQIADQLNEQGFKMNHSTARNVYVKALMKIASEVTDLYDVTMDQKKLKKEKKFFICLLPRGHWSIVLSCCKSSLLIF